MSEVLAQLEKNGSSGGSVETGIFSAVNGTATVTLGWKPTRVMVLFSPPDGSYTGIWEHGAYVDTILGINYSPGSSSMYLTITDTGFSLYCNPGLQMGGQPMRYLAVNQ